MSERLRIAITKGRLLDKSVEPRPEEKEWKRRK